MTIGTYVSYPSGGSGSGSITVPTAADLPTGVPDGSTAVTLDTHAFYIYDAGTTTWILQTASTGMTGPGVSVDNQIVLFSGTGGNTAKAATGSGAVFATGSGVYNAGVITIPFLMGESADYTTGGYLFSETGNDTGFTSPSDGIITVWANAQNAAEFSQSGISQIRGVPYSWPNGQGGAGTFLGNDGTGILSWQNATNHAVQYIENYDAAGGSSQRNYLQTNITATADASSDNIILFNYFIDDGSAFDTGNTTLQNLNFNSGGAGAATKQSMASINIGANYGDGATTQTLGFYRGVNNELVINDNGNATNVYMSPTGLSAPGASTTIANYVGRNDDSNIATVGNFSAELIQSQIGHATGTVYHFGVFSNVTTADAGVSGFNFGTNVGTSNSINPFQAGGNWGTVTGNGSLLSSSGNITSVVNWNDIALNDTMTTVTSSYGMLDGTTNIGTINNYNGIWHHPVLGTVSGNTQGFADSTIVTTSVNGYMGFHENPTIALTNGPYIGMKMDPTVTGNGTTEATGLEINLTNVSNMAAGNVHALKTDGAPNTYTYNATAVSGAFLTFGDNYAHELFVPDATTVTGTTEFADFHNARYRLGDTGASMDAGPFGIGNLAHMFQVAPSGLPASGTMAQVNNVTVLLNPDGGSTGGTLNEYNALFVVQAPGGAFTVNNSYAVRIKSLGGVATNRWGIYQDDADNNYLAGNLGIGTPTPAYALEVSSGDIRSSGDHQIVQESFGGTIALAGGTRLLGSGNIYLDTSGGGSVNIRPGIVTTVSVDTTGIGFFGTTPVAQQASSGPQTAGAVYTSTEQTMLQQVYDAMRAYGLLS